ncbi:hypothetical protein SAMN02910292_02668 [Lachnospiraceae bacterium XBB2008]|nr:hypothetical protein SAMN02910292_02668 [Lachnospiraceae bacterium XBB2008]
MPIPQETIKKMQALSSDQMSIVINLVDQLSAATPLDIFEALRADGQKYPMSEEEVNAFVANVRAERNAAGN